MRYIVRLNPHAYNPITKKVMANRVWEVEQRADKDSEKVIWHCANVRIGVRPVQELFTAPKKGEPPWEVCYQGTCYTDGQDNAIVILGVPDV